MSSTCALGDERPAHSTATRAAGILRGFGQMVVCLAAAMMEAHRRARTRHVLSSLDDAALKDIGLSRGQIDAFERDPRYTPRFPGF